MSCAATPALAPPREAPAALVQAVQDNCDVADARHGADMSLCVYLLQMREFYRWERGMGLGSELSRAEVGDWIAQREARWDGLEGQGYRELPLPGGARLDPFDAEAVNAQLLPHGLLYGAGLLGAGRPVFFLAELHRHEQREGLAVLQGGRELARGLLAPPAALAAGAQGPVIVRRESLARWGWERWEAFARRPHESGAFRAQAEAYGFSAGFEQALPRWLEDQVELAVLHEVGEHRAGQRLGPQWEELVLSLPSRRANGLARAVRDHIADLGYTLPRLLDEGAAPRLHAWFAAYDGHRQALFPSLPAGYAAWCKGDGGRALRAACAQGAAHFGALAKQVLDLHGRLGEAAAEAIERQLSAPSALCPPA